MPESVAPVALIHADELLLDLTQFKLEHCGIHAYTVLLAHGQPAGELERWLRPQTLVCILGDRPWKGTHDALTRVRHSVPNSQLILLSRNPNVVEALLGRAADYYVAESAQAEDTACVIVATVRQALGVAPPPPAFAQALVRRAAAARTTAQQTVVKSSLARHRSLALRSMRTRI